MKKILLIVFLLAIYTLTPTMTAQATVVEINFPEGTVPNSVGNFYEDISFENFVFFNWSGNVGDDFPLTDFWGISINSSQSPDLKGRINFPSPVDFFEINGVINNSTFSDSVEWNLTALNNNGDVVDFISSGLFNPNNQNGLYIFSTLRVDAPSAISKVLINQQAPLGEHVGWALDSVRFDLKNKSNAIPEPSTVFLLGASFLSFLFKRKRT